MREALKHAAAALLCLAPFGLTASSAVAIDVEGQPQTVTVPVAPNIALTNISLCADSTDSPWAAIGLTRPAWIAFCAERRLRLLPALPEIEQSVAQDVQGYFADHGPGLAVGLVLDDGLFYSQGFGFRDAQKKFAPDETTVFRAGSLSKVMTGTGLLTLIDDPAQHMSLSDSADSARYVPELKFVCPAGASTDPTKLTSSCARGTNDLKIQLKHLVSHTSGLPNVLSTGSAWMDELKKSELLFPPGTYAAYSGVAVELAGLLEQRVSGEPSYTDFITKHLFLPLGMTHSSMDQTKVPQDLLAQKWNLVWSDPAPLYATWSLSAIPQLQPGETPNMLTPAGGLATSVWDLSRFMKMWLSGVAPSVNGRPLLKSSTIQSANLPQVPVSTAPPQICGGANPDSHQAYFSQCIPANVFGVNWVVVNTPFLHHNGKLPRYSGSSTYIDQPGKMGATGLVSTDPYPNPKDIAANYLQPPNLDPGFIDTVVQTHLLTAGLTADAKTTWKGERLAAGTARLLWLSGVDAPPSIVGTVINPTLQPQVIEHPNVAPSPPPGPITGRAEAVQQPSPTQPNQETPEQKDQDQLLDQFTPAFRTQNQLTGANVASFVAGIFGGVHHCSTFRIRRVFGADKIALRFECRDRKSNAAESFDVTLTVNSAGRIAALSDAGATGEAY
jgi:CubicO group peptidase (beta-lactamase class C family)